MNHYYRHGDILLKPVAVPAGAQVIHEGGDYVLAEGEATGHKHTLRDGKTKVPDFLVFEFDGETYLRVAQSTKLDHQEHNTVDVVPGDYQVDREREYDPWAQDTTRVID